MKRTFRNLTVLLLLAPLCLNAQYRVSIFDFLEAVGLKYNAAGPFLIKTDTLRNRVITANTLTSNVSIIDGATDFVTNIPLTRRGFQHLKSDAMVISNSTGKIYLIGRNCYSIIDPETKTGETITTDKQFESICVDEKTGNIFLAGRECKELGFYSSETKKLEFIKWLDFDEKLINQNQTPPPPNRKVVPCNDDKSNIIAIDGYTSTLHIFNGKTGKHISQRNMALSKGGRWHLAGYDESTKKLYLVTESDQRQAKEAAEIDVFGKNDKIVNIPEGFSEPTAILYNPKYKYVYINSDNVRSMYVVEFKTPSILKEVPVPDFGNDAYAFDMANDILYIGSWAHGEVHIIDLKQNKFLRKIERTGIIPHMFTMTYNPKNKKVYFPMGASAVNGCFGAAVSQLDPEENVLKRIRIGWAPIDIIELEQRNTIVVFNNEDMLSELNPKGFFNAFELPFSFPIAAAPGPEGSIYLSYGPHQSYWPTVYIWDAKNGILKIMPTSGSDPFEFYDRRIPRQAMQLASDKNGELLMTMNNWGREPQFIGRVIDGVRNFDIGERIELQDTVQREVTQRLMRYDADKDMLYLARIAEIDGEPGIFQAISIKEKETKDKKEVKNLKIGNNPCDMIFDKDNIYIANFSSNSISIINKDNYNIKEFNTADGPLKLVAHNNKIWVLNHLGKSIQAIGEDKVYEIPFEGLPNNIFSWNGKLFVTQHNEKEMYVLEFNEDFGKFNVVHKTEYPYGETSFATNNSSFYVSGQYGDAIFSITKAIEDKSGALWITDFLAGRVYKIEKQ